MSERKISVDDRTVINRKSPISGMSLVEVLIAMAISTIVLYATVSAQVSQQREATALGQKLASLDLEKLLISTLADGSVCQYILNNPAVLTFDSRHVSSTTPQLISPTTPPFQIYANVQTGPPVVTGPVVAAIGQQASPFSTSAIIKSIALSISGAPSPMPSPGPGASFTGNWVITLDSSKLVRAILPISIATSLTVDTTNPAAAKITSCSSAAVSAPQQVLSGSLCGMTVFYSMGCPYSGGYNTWGLMANCDGKDPRTACPTGYTFKVVYGAECNIAYSCVKN